MFYFDFYEIEELLGVLIEVLRHVESRICKAGLAAAAQLAGVTPPSRKQVILTDGPEVGASKTPLMREW